MNRVRIFVFRVVVESKRLARMIVCVVMTLSASLANAAEAWTSTIPISYIQIASDVTPGAGVVISSNAVGAKEVLANAMLAKATGKSVSFYGVCQGSAHIIVKQIFVSQ